MSSIETQKLNAPSYISKESLEKILKNVLKTPNIEVENYIVSLACDGGDNYTSHIYRVVVKYKNPEGKSATISLIFKELQIDGDSRKVITELDIFGTEKVMYMEIIPAIEKLIGNNTMIAAKCYDILQSKHVYVLQDLKELGYEVSDRINGLNEKECEIILKKIGQFHAASMILRKTKEETLKYFNRGIFCKISIEAGIVKELVEGHLNHLIKIINEWPNYETIAKKLRKITPLCLKICEQLSKLQTKRLNVLNHGDLWVNNIMIKYDNNKNPYDAVFVDLQTSVYGSLGIDIQYFLNTSPQLEVLKTKRYDLLKVYYHSLRSTLKMLEYSPIPSWDDVRKEIRSMEFYGLISFTTIFPLITMDRSESADNTIESIIDKNIAMKKRDIMFSSKRMIETMKYSLNRFDELGILDL